MFPPRRSYSISLPAGRTLDLGRRALVMGILNVTPDSFAEPAVRLDTEAAVEWALQMVAHLHLSRDCMKRREQSDNARLALHFHTVSDEMAMSRI